MGQHRDIAIATAKTARVSGITQLFIEHVRAQFSKDKE
jgi:hypothetical protein